MSEYIGKTCPYCKTPFREGDDIVICSVCEMPHHKECWVENRECTTFGCTGTIQGVSAKNAGLAFCPYCGTPHNVGAAFCGTCGNSLTGTAAPRPAQPVNQTYAPPQQTYTHPRQPHTPQQQTYVPPQYGYTPAHPVTGPYDALIAEKAEYYNKQFNAMDAKGTKASWNWPAFLIAPLWCVYRKMYVHAAALFVLSALLGKLGWIGVILNIAVCVAFGIFANHIYREYLKKVSDFAASVSEPAKSRYLSTHTGADMNKAALICVIACIISALLGL